MLTCRVSPGAIAVFTDRTGGVSSPPFDSANLATHVGDAAGNVRENRARLAARLGTHPVWMDQVHGAEVRVLTAGAGETAGECDAVVVAGVDGHAPAVLVADCVPLLLADRSGGVRAAVHVGRAGLFAGIVPLVVERMREVADGPLWVVAGPHVCGRCYEVGAELSDRARPLGADCETRWGTPGIDLMAGIARQLPDVPLSRVGGCTVEDPLLFSHRREGVTGRFAGLVLCDTPNPM